MSLLQCGRSRRSQSTVDEGEREHAGARALLPLIVLNRPYHHSICIFCIKTDLYKVARTLANSYMSRIIDKQNITEDLQADLGLAQAMKNTDLEASTLFYNTFQVF